MKAVVCFFIIFIFSVHLYAQKLLNGKVLNEKNEPLSSVVINVFNIQDEQLIAYGITDEKGEYNIHLSLIHI